MFYHSLLSDWNHGNAHFLRGIATELIMRGNDVAIYEPEGNWSLDNLVREHGEEVVQEFYRYYPLLKSIIVYPSTYVVPGEHSIGGGVWEEGEDELLGHTSSRLSALVLAWDSTLHGARDVRDGENVVFHEFAHQLDFESGDSNGTPLLGSNQQYASWARVLGAEYERLRRTSEEGRPSVLDEYGAENPAEFFAVATEAFFERPVELRAKHPALYDELRAYYEQDPAAWPGTSTS
jgi:Mlc titration factor MtfA (ptsG expression regulator)